MIIQAGDLGVELDTGTNAPGAILQCLDNGEWRDYLVDGKLVTRTIELESLPPGRYRLTGKR